MIDDIDDPSPPTPDALIPRSAKRPARKRRKLPKKAKAKTAMPRATAPRLRHPPMIAEAVPPEQFPVFSVDDPDLGDVPPLSEILPRLPPDALTRIRIAARSVCRIEGFLDSDLHIGTGFVVGANLIATNRHVAEAVAGGPVRIPTEISGDLWCINFGREAPGPPQGQVLLRRLVLLHPYWDFALFETARLPDAAVPLPIAATPALDLDGRVIAVIGYPGGNVPDAFRDTIFGGVLGLKRIQPGRLRAPRDHVDDRGVRISSLDHSASTASGNSGSPVIDVETGTVVAIHYGGAHDLTNWSVPTFDLRKDERVFNHPGLVFTEGGMIDPSGPWIPFWDAIGDRIEEPVD